MDFFSIELIFSIAVFGFVFAIFSTEVHSDL